LISGTPASGKSSVSHALMQRFPRGVHIPVDNIREMVVSGAASPVPWTEETALQFALGREAAVKMALLYDSAGFTVVIDDVVSNETFQKDYAPYFGATEPRKILLHAPLAVALSRNANRVNKGFDTSVLEHVITMLHKDFSQMETSTWHVIDSSTLTVEATVDKIID
jgi:predicted kinase